MSDKIREAFEHAMTHDFKVIVGSADPYPAGLERDWWRVWQKAWQAAVAQQPAPVAVPDGWRLVPVEPTEQMIMAGYYPELKAAQRAEMYRAMLAASPEVKNG